MAGKYLKRGAIVDVIKSQEATRTPHPMTADSPTHSEPSRGPAQARLSDIIGSLLLSCVAVLAAQAVLFLGPVIYMEWVGVPFRWGQALTMMFFFVFIAAGHLVLVGLPMFYFMAIGHRLNWRNVSLAGVITGVLSPAILSWPRGAVNGFDGGNFHGKWQVFVDDGIPTAIGWLRYGEVLLIYAVHGLIGAWIFYGVWRWARSDDPPNPRPDVLVSPQQ